MLSLKNAFASISAAITPARASSIASRRPSRSSKERRFSVISRENCENKKNFKNESQKKLESIIFSSALMYEIETTTKKQFKKKYDYDRIDRIRIWDKLEVGGEQFTLSFHKPLGEGGYGVVYLLKGKSASRKEIKITIKTMINNDEKYISSDLMKSKCEILRVKVFGDMDIKASNSAANFNAFMEPASGSLNNYTKTNKLTNEQILDIGQQILEQLRCLYNLTPTEPKLKKYLYTDLKSGNVLYFDCGKTENKKRLKVQLGDLGSAVSIPKKDNLNEFIFTYPAFEHREGGGIYEIDLKNEDVCSQVTSYQLGMLLFLLMKDTSKKGFLFSHDIPVEESDEVTELYSKLESLLPGLSYLVKYNPDERPNMFSDDSLKTLIEKHKSDIEKQKPDSLNSYPSSYTVSGSKKRGSVKKKGKEKKGRPSRKKKKK